MLSRRAFFARASAAAIGALTLDPERLLWVPGQKTIFDLGASFPDDTAYLQWLFDTQQFIRLNAGTYRIDRTLRVPLDAAIVGAGKPTTLEWTGPSGMNMLQSTPPMWGSA